MFRALQKKFREFRVLYVNPPMYLRNKHEAHSEFVNLLLEEEISFARAEIELTFWTGAKKTYFPRYLIKGFLFG